MWSNDSIEQENVCAELESESSWQRFVYSGCLCVLTIVLGTYLLYITGIPHLSLPLLEASNFSAAAFYSSQVSIYCSAVSFYKIATHQFSLTEDISIGVDKLSFMSEVAAAVFALLTTVSSPNSDIMPSILFDSLIDYFKFIILPICLTIIAVHSRANFTQIDNDIRDLRKNKYNFKKA